MQEYVHLSSCHAVHFVHGIEVDGGYALVEGEEVLLLFYPNLFDIIFTFPRYFFHFV